jgi:crotonobetainyl-CoA:carnitine CoA-transferase CaiB-like acyl-CoA transferase
VDGSLLETAVGLLNFQAEGNLLTGSVPRALGSAHPSLSPYRNFQCRDGQWIFIAGANDRLFRRLVTALGRAELADDPRFVVNVERVRHRAELEATLGQAIAQHDRAPLLELLLRHDVPATPVNSVPQVLQDAQTQARGIVQRVRHPRLGDIPMVSMPLTFGGERPPVRRAPPARGEHTEAVLAECGYSPAEIAALREAKVVR